MDPYIGEIRLFAGNYAPRGWALCNGALLPISSNTVLFSIIGIQYGGNGTTNFALPDLRGRAPLHQGAGPGLTERTIGETGGESSVTLLETEIPSHTHVPNGTTAATSGVADPTNAIWGSESVLGAKPYIASSSSLVSMSPLALGAAGGSQPHNNMQPFLGLNFIIALDGVFPPRS